MTNLARRAARSVTWERVWRLIMSIGLGDAYFVAEALTGGADAEERLSLE